MHKLIIIFSLFSIQLVAQATLPAELDSPAERADRLTKEMIEKVGLFPSQIKVVDSLNYAYALEMQAEVFDKKLSTWGQYRRGNRIMNRKDEELKGILTGKQFEKYDDLKSEVLWKIVGQIF